VHQQAERPTIVQLMADGGLIAAWVAVAVAITTAAGTYARDRREKRRAQAGRVAAWWDPDISPLKGPMLMNASELPVFTLAVRSAASHTGDTFYRIDVLPPFEHPISASEAMSQNTPTLSRSYGPTLFEIPNPPTKQIRQVTFMDAAGVWWNRDEKGRLTEVSEEDAQGFLPKVSAEIPTRRWRRLLIPVRLRIGRVLTIGGSHRRRGARRE
jgi:hypothetical protein